MTSFTALTTLTGKDRAEALCEAMERLDPAPSGVGTFEVEDGKGVWEVGGYFSQTPDQAALALLAAAFATKPFAVFELPKTDWVAHVRRELAPIRAGRFFLYGSHDAGKLPDGVVPLLVDAALAFGTGHHGTTKGCLLALDRLVGEGFVAQNVADIGCGTAVLAMAAAKLWPGRRILASDIDPVAVETAFANVALNGLAGQVDCVECEGFDHATLQGAAPFDLVFANILKAPLLALAPDMGQHVSAGGVAILSGILNAQAKEIIAAYQTEGFELRESDRLGDWSTLSLAKLPL